MWEKGVEKESVVYFFLLPFEGIPFSVVTAYFKHPHSHITFHNAILPYNIMHTFLSVSKGFFFIFALRHAYLH